MSQDKQLFQIQNILDTLQEATDHFSTLVKNKELNQSIFMFSSIVEGCQAIIVMLNSVNKSFTSHTTKIENYLFMIANELEKGNFVKISQIVQFSFRPQLNKLQKDFIDTLGNQQKDDVILIGVFHSWANPLKFYPEERINAMVKESERQGAILYFFTSDDVDFESKQVNADTFRNNSWERVNVPFPDVINNVGAGRRSHIERKLRREVPFTSFHVGNKFTLPKRMIKYRKFADLLVPFKVCSSEEIIYDFLERNNRVVFKALGSNRGENIYFITKKDSRYVLLDQRKERIINQEAFQKFIQQTILHKKGSYIIQRYIHTRTNNDEPYHFRAQMQKDGEGKWVITHIYASIGNKKGNLSNLSAGGRNEDLRPFLYREFGQKSGNKYEETLLKLSLDVAWHLDKLYGLVLDELGLDFAIDDAGRIWMHEANNGPQTAFFEDKRAVHKIAYAKYIAKNGVMYSDAASKSAITKGQFQASKTDLPLAIDEKQLIAGMLVGRDRHDPFTLELAKNAAEKDILFYYFTPLDIDYDLGLIRGSFYENGEWQQRVAEFPNVIIDRLKLRDKEEAHMIYEELQDIPFTNEWAHAINRVKLYETVHQDIDSVLVNYQKVTRPRSVFQFLERFGNVLLKPENTSSINEIYSIRATERRSYLVIQGTKTKYYSEIQLRNWIRDLIDKQSFVVQQDRRTINSKDELSEIHLHLMKNGEHEWSIVSLYAQVQKLLEDLSIEEYKLNSTNFSGDETIWKKLKELSIKTANTLDNALEKPVSELAIAACINEEQEISILDIDLSGPNAVYDASALAESSLTLARYLAVSKADTVMK